MQPGLTFPSAQPILMDRFATKAPNAHPKAINSTEATPAAHAQATSHNRQKNVSLHTHHAPTFRHVTRVRCLDFSIRFSQNSRLLSPQGLFISLFTPVSQQISLQYLAPSPSAKPNGRSLTAFFESTQDRKTHQSLPSLPQYLFSLLLSLLPQHIHQ